MPMATSIEMLRYVFFILLNVEDIYFSLEEINPYMHFLTRWINYLKTIVPVTPAGGSELYGLKTGASTSPKSEGFVYMRNEQFD